jgi:hypothetical protein
MVDGVRASGVGGPSPLAREDSKAGAGQFLVDPGPAPAAQNTRLATTAAIGLESMLALQAVDEADERDRAARKRGARLIAALTGLQRAMLAREDPAMALRVLDELTLDEPVADDPRLGAILRAVVLRSRVELARSRLEAAPRSDRR